MSTYITYVEKRNAARKEIFPMKWRFQTKWILHFLPLWVLGIAFLLPFVCDGIEFCLSY